MSRLRLFNGFVYSDLDHLTFSPTLLQSSAHYSSKLGAYVFKKANAVALIDGSYTDYKVVLEGRFWMDGGFYKGNITSVKLKGPGGKTYYVVDQLDNKVSLMEYAVATQYWSIDHEAIPKLLFENGITYAMTGGADTYFGTSANDVLNGLGGNDILFGNAGADRLAGGNGKDFLYGGDGRDVLLGGNGNDTQRGNDGKDRLMGGSHDDRQYGGDGDDILAGQAGSDQLQGDSGADVLIGGRGADVFVFSSTSDSGVGKGNRDVILDFTPNKDVLDFSLFSQSLTYIGKAGFHGVAGEIRWVKGAKKTLVQVDLDGDSDPDFEIQLSKAVRLDADDFIV